jgi:hypothetical protein
MRCGSKGLSGQTGFATEERGLICDYFRFSFVQEFDL